MYSQHAFGYMPGPYVAGPYVSAGYEPYYPEELQQMPLSSVPRPAPPPPRPPQPQRLSIRDPRTGAEVPVITPQQVEQAVASYYKERLPEDLVSLDLHSLSAKCQAIFNKASDSAETQDPATFMSSALHPAAKQGLPHCQYYLGRCYETGQGNLPGNQDLCKTWFYQASELGILEASYKLGQCYEDGWGCPKSMSEAVRLYKIAVDGGIQAAKLRLGFLHEVGNSVPQDPVAAFDLYQQATDLTEGILCAARCYQFGIGTQVDLHKARHLYEKACDRGSGQAAELLAAIEEQIALRDQWRVSSDHSANGNGQSVNQPEKKPNPVPVIAVGVNEDEANDESPGGSRPNPEAKPFVPKVHASTGLKPHAKEFKPQANTSSSGSAATPPRKGPKMAPPTGAAWKAAFTAQAAPFQPKQAASSTQPAPENGEPTTTTSDPAPADATQQKSESPAASNSALSDTKEETKSPAAKLAQHQSPESQLKTASVSAAQNNHSPVKLAASAEEGPPQTAVSSNGRDHTAASTASSAVVEDLDVLHTEQMSAAWAALDAATGADHPTAAAINEALRHARPYRELAECIRAAERFLSNLQSQTAGQLPNSQHSMAQSTESQTVSGSQAADDVEEAEDSVPDVNADGDQQDGTASIAGSEVVSRRSVQPLHDIETESFSSHQDPEQFQWQPYDADPLRSSTSSSQPLEAPAQDQAASHKPFVLSPKAVASAKAAAVLALAQPATVQIEHPPASVSSLSSSSPTFLSHAQPEPLSQPEQPAYAEPSPQPEQQFAVDTDRPDESTNVGTTMPATQSTAKPPSSMLDFLSFLLPAENLTANPTPKRQPPPGFEAPKLQGQSASGRAADTSAQGASQQPQGLPRRAKAYQSAVTRGPAALYQPPGMAEHHTSEDSWNAADDASQQQQYSLHEPYQEQEPAADVWQQQQTVKYDPPQQQQASKYDPAHQQQQAAKYDPAHQQQQQQAPKYDPVHQQRPALYIPAPLQQSSAPGNASRPTSAYTYNPPDVDSSSISGQLGAEGSTDDVLAELLGLPQTSPQSLPEAPAAPSVAQLDLEALIAQRQDTHSSSQPGMMTSDAKQQQQQQPQAETQPAHAQQPFMPTGDTLSASSSHGEATVPQAAEHQQQLAQAESTELSMKLDSSNAELMASGQAKGSRPDSEPDADAQSNSSRADSLAADQASGAKKRAVDDDYSVSSAKTRGKAKRKGSPVKTGAASAATPVASQTTLADATAASHGEHGHAPSAAPSEGDAQRPAVAKSTSSSSLGSVPSFLPPKPKPGGNKAKAAAVPDTSFAVEQPQVLAPLPQPPVSAVKEAAVAPPRRPQPQTQAAHAPAQQAKAVPRGQHQPQKQSAATKRPQKQSSAGGQASFQARVTPQLHAAEPSGQQQRQPEDSDDDEWETVGHKAGPRQAPAAKQAKLKGPSVQKPLSQAQTAQGSFGQEPQPMLEQSQIESPAAFQPLPSTQKPAAAVNIAPNSAWAKKLDLQAASSGGRGAPGPGAAASQQPAVPMSVQGKPSIQDHSYPNPPSSNAAAPSDSNHHSKPVSWPSSSAVPAEQSPQQPAGTDAAPVGASPGAAAAAPASSNAPAPSDQPKAEGRTASAGQKAKGKGKKKKGQGKQEQQGTFQEPRAEQPNPAGPVPAPGAAAIAGELKASAAGQAPRSAASAVAGNTGPLAAEDIANRQQEAMMTVIADGMKVTANNKNAWNEICTCPLSLDVMREPVVACDGITYEREEIVKWLQKGNNTSPWTGMPFDNKDLTPNILVSKLISKFNLVESGV